MKPFMLRVLLLFFVLLFSSQALASSSAVMESFNKEVSSSTESQVTDVDKGRHQILFIMGVILLILIFLTAGISKADCTDLAAVNSVEEPEK